MKIKNIVITPIYIDQVAQEIKKRVEKTKTTGKPLPTDTTKATWKATMTP